MKDRKRERSEPSFGEGSDTSKNFETEALVKSFLILLAHEKNQTRERRNERMRAFSSFSSYRATDKPAVYPFKMTRNLG